MRNVTATPQYWWRVAIVLAAACGVLAVQQPVQFFTSQSNLLVLAYYAGTLYWMRVRGTTDPPAPRLRGLITLAISITGLIAHFLLAGGANPLPGLAAHDPSTALLNWALLLVHYVVPIMVLTDWIAFGPHRVVPWRDVPLWILYPLTYGLVMEIRAIVLPAAPVRYPYYFLDPTTNGYGWVAGQFLMLAVIFAVIGSAVLGLDRLSARLKSRKPAPEPAPQHPAEVS